MSIDLKFSGPGLPPLGDELIPQSLCDMPIVDDDVKVATIYRYGGTVEEPRRPHKKHDMHIELEATRLESQCNQPALAKGAPITSHWPLKQNPGNAMAQMACCKT